MSEPIEAGQRRRRFLVALAVAALAVGLPLAALAMWWGTSIAYALAGSANPRQAFCPLPPLDDGRLRMEELELRRRIAAIESDLARRRGQCPICPEPEAVDIGLIVDTSASMRWPASLDATGERAKMADI